MKVRISNLAREMGIKPRAILHALEPIGITQPKSHSSSIDDDQAERVRTYFKDQIKITRPTQAIKVKAKSEKTIDRGREARGPSSKRGFHVDRVERNSQKRNMVGKFDGVKKPQTREARIFERHLRREAVREASHLLQPQSANMGVVMYGPGNLPLRVLPPPQEPNPRVNDPLIQCKKCDHKIYRSAMAKHIQNCHSEGPARLLPNIRTARLPFVILPPGTWDFQKVFEHYFKQSHFHKFGPPAIDVERIRKLATLRPTMRHIGVRAWFGYAAYEFSYSKKVVLESPIEGNATYVLSGDWMNMIDHTKAEIRKQFSRDVKRIFHREHWLRELRAALTKRHLPENSKFAPK